MRLGHCRTTGDPAMPESEPKPAERILAKSIGSPGHCSLRRFRESSQFQPEHLRTKNDSRATLADFSLSQPHTSVFHRSFTSTFQMPTAPALSPSSIAGSETSRPGTRKPSMFNHMPKNNQQITSPPLSSLNFGDIPSSMDQTERLQ